MDDQVLTERLRAENPDFRRWSEEHRRLERRLAALNRHRFLTPSEEQEKKRLQKEKLLAKDRMVQILYHYKRMRAN